MLLGSATNGRVRIEDVLSICWSTVRGISLAPLLARIRRAFNQSRVCGANSRIASRREEEVWDEIDSIAWLPDAHAMEQMLEPNLVSLM
jgi:hypothetical protein